MPLRHSAPRLRKDKMMNKKIKLLIAACTLALFCLFLVSCSNKDVYDEYDKNGYNITIQYDANGGYFKDSQNVGLTDTYNISKYEENENGMVEIMLFEPNSDQRGEKENIFSATRSDGEYYVAGWFAKRTEVVDENGNVSYKYSEKWDFSKPLLVDPKGEYSASDPYITLYAVWNEKTEDNYHKIEIYDADNPKSLVAEYTYGSGYEPIVDASKVIELPNWDKATGAMSYGVFENLGAKIEGKTLDSVYLDEDCKIKLEGETYMHPVTINDQGQLENRVLKLYFKYKEGNLYKISDAKQLAKATDLKATYEIISDIDFSKSTWPSAFRNGIFEGKIIGNGYTIKNIGISGADDRNYLGLFKEISKDAEIENVTFSNITVKFDELLKQNNGRYALFASLIQEGFAFENVTIKESKFIVAASIKDALTLDQTPEIGLLCAEGYYDGLGIDISGIVPEVLATDADSYILEIEIDADNNGLLLNFQDKPIEE